MPRYVPTVGPEGAKIFIVGEAPGQNEDITGLPFQGSAGKLLNKLLFQAGIARTECLVGNVARIRPPDNNIAVYFEDKKMTIPKPILQEWLNELREEIIRFRPNVVIALGRTALWALTGQTTISRFRGYVTYSTLAPKVKVLPSYHPAAILRENKYYFPTLMDLRKAKHHSDSPILEENERKLIAPATYRDWMNYCQSILEHPEWERLALDVENTHAGYITELGFSHSNDFAMTLRLYEGGFHRFTEREECELWEISEEVINTRKKLIMHNASHDTIVMLAKHNIHCKNLYMDTLIAAHILWPELPRDLGFLASICLDTNSWKHLRKSDGEEYNPQDACNTFGIAEVLEKQLTLYDGWDTFNKEMSFLQAAMFMQVKGVKIDEEKRQELISNCQLEIDETKRALALVVGREVNYESPKQLAQLLYIDMELPFQYKRRKKATEERKVTTDAEALIKLERMFPDNQLFQLIMRHKKAIKLMTFLDIPISPEGRVHTSYNVTGSSRDDDPTDDSNFGKRSFGRWSSSKSIIFPYGSGNLQNIPPKARLMYGVDDPKYTLVQADYVQAEAVVVAYLSGDQVLMRLFEESYGMSSEEKKAKGYDIHRLTASMMFNTPIEQVTKQMRDIGKRLRHAVSYSAGPKVVAVNIGISEAEAKALLNKYHFTYPMIRLWQKRITDQLAKDMTLTNLWGRKHRFFDRWGDSLFRSAYSFIPQSSVGDLLNLAMTDFYNQYCCDKDISLCLQLHDAMYVQCPEERVNEVMGKMRKCMAIPVPYEHGEFLIDIDFKVGKSWGSLDETEYVEETTAELD